MMAGVPDSSGNFGLDSYTYPFIKFYAGVTSSSTGTDTKFGLYGYATLAPTATSSAVVIGTRGEARGSTGQTLNGGAVGGSFLGYNQGSGPLLVARGAEVWGELLSSGNITEADALYARLKNAGTGTISVAAGVVVDTPQISSGAMSNVYGVYIGNQTGGGTSNYALYSDGGRNYFAGEVYVRNSPSVGSPSVYSYKSSTVTTSSDFSVYGQTLHSPGATSSATVYGVYGEAGTSGAQTLNGTLGGVQGIASHGGSASLAKCYGGEFVSKATSSGGVTNAVGGVFQVENTGTGTTSNAYGIKILDAIEGQNATITNQYQLYIEAPTKGTTKYGIYCAGGQSHFEDYVDFVSGATFSAPVVIEDTGYAPMNVGQFNDDPGLLWNYDLWVRSDLKEIRIRFGATTYKLALAAV